MRRRRSVQTPCDDRVSCPADVVDRKLSQTSLPLASPTRRRRNVLSSLRTRAAWPADVDDRRLSRRILPLAFPMRGDSRYPDTAARTSPVAHQRRRPLNSQCAPSPRSSLTVDCSRRGCSTRPRCDDGPTFPRSITKDPPGPCAAKWHTVPEAIVRRANPRPADGVGCTMPRRSYNRRP